MNTPLKVTAFALGLAAVFGAALVVGAAVGPVGTAAADRTAHGMADDTAAGHDEAAGEHDDEHDAGHLPAGLAVTEDGYTLALDHDALPAGAATPLAFRILGPDGRPVTAFDTSHDEPLHLIAVRRDLTGFQHVHPALGADGTWRIPLALTPGTWRLFADFVPTDDGENRVLGADLAVAGNYSPTPLPAATTTTQV